MKPLPALDSLTEEEISKTIREISVREKILLHS